MKDYRININYAKALFLLSQDLGCQEQSAADMTLVRDVCTENHTLSVVFKNPVIKEAKKSAIVSELFEGKVTESTLKFLQFVVKKNRSVNLKGIAESFLDLYCDSRNIVRSQITSAVPVNQECLDIVRQMVADYTHKEVKLVSSVNETMLGGFKLEFDNNMYDARLRTKFQKLRSEFSKNVYESKL